MSKLKNLNSVLTAAELFLSDLNLFKKSDIVELRIVFEIKENETVLYHLYYSGIFE